MVKVWAEKEMRNYRRIFAARIPTPQPIFLKSHVLLMEFLGKDGWPSPRLKDASLSERHMREAYVQTVLIMRHLYQRCKLVHGDFSEYNLLWHNKQVYVIDVSQSVETDHPAALDFLRKDASNVNDFFGKIGRLDVMTTRQLFDFITTTIDDNEEAEMEYLDKMMKEVQDAQNHMAGQTEQERRKNEQQDAVDEAVFMSSFLPRSLNQVADYDVRQIEKGEVEATYAHAVAALTGNQEVVEKYNTYQRGEGITDEAAFGDDIDPANEGISDNQSEDDDSGSDSDSDDDEEYIKVARTPEELEAERADLKAQRKANKKAVREANTEKRQTKIKKKDKKRAIKKAKAGNRKNK